MPVSEALIGVLATFVLGLVVVRRLGVEAAPKGRRQILARRVKGALAVHADLLQCSAAVLGAEPVVEALCLPVLWKRMWELVRERHLFIADFWNSGTVTYGCLAGGRPGGYLYVDWNGSVCPCVFVPYSPVNIKDAYRQGKTLNDVWREPFFAGIREWQRGYGYKETGMTAPGQGNWLMPCLIRDHHPVFDRLAREIGAQPADADARAAQQGPSYREGLATFHRELAAAMDPIWERQYLCGQAPAQHPVQPPPAPSRWEPGSRPRDEGDPQPRVRAAIRQIEAKALRKLRHPSRSEHLRSFLD